MTPDLSDIRIVDADTHVIEPADLWTSRVSTARWGDAVPHVRWDDDRREEFWYFGDRRIAGAGAPAMAGWPEYWPDHPRRLADVDPRASDAATRLAHMDSMGIHAQVLYPNVSGFGAGRLTRLDEPELMLQCTAAYNDFLVEWGSVAPDRFVPVMAIPFWDMDATGREIERAAALGHRGIVMTSVPQAWGMPPLVDPYWNRLWDQAEQMGLPINFHIGSGEDTGKVVAESELAGAGPHVNTAWTTVGFFLANASAVSKLIMGGICHRYPRLDFVSVESGVGWVPFLLEALDWQWINNGIRIDHPEYDLLPSEYFARQIYACFWFEDASARLAIDALGAGNLLYETDYPHPTSMSPGPASSAVEPRRYIAETLGHLPEASLRKVLHDNAARVYHLA